jgi:hypothetical protein
MRPGRCWRRSPAAASCWSAAAVPVPRLAPHLARLFAGRFERERPPLAALA